MNKVRLSPDLISIYMQSDDITNGIDEKVVFSVSEVVFHLRQVIESRIDTLYINGEISNFVRHSSGHLYFNLKDDNAVIKCAFFRSQNYVLDFLPQDGEQVICLGKITVYEKSGSLQMVVQNLFPYGKGMLQKKFEQLKLKLKEEGLFEHVHKVVLPKYPDSIGIITSPTGAALQDVLNILKRRYPCKIIVFPSLMQGEEAPRQVINGIEFFNTMKNADLIIITRGGGSKEDLFCFNDEKLARAIFASGLPVVSAIGHEIDFTIADFVADLRAPTPSAAAELVTPDKAETISMLNIQLHLMGSSIRDYVNIAKNQIHKAHLKVLQYHPEKIWQTYQQRFDTAELSILKFLDVIYSQKKEIDYQQNIFYTSLLHVSTRYFLSRRHKLDLLSENIRIIVKERIQAFNHQTELLQQSIENLSVQKVLERGYSLALKENKVIKSIKEIAVNDKLKVVVSDGKAEVVIEKLDET